MMDQAWQSSPFFVEPLQPPPLQAKAGWKTLEAELQYQSQYCHDKIQRDMGNLHAQEGCQGCQRSTGAGEQDLGM
eukprot:s41_g1.t1